MVSLHDVTTEVVVSLGAVDQLVGAAEPVDATAETRQALATVPRVSGLESIVMAQPSLVLGLQVIETADPDLLRRLREEGIAVRLFSLANLSDVYAMTRQIGAQVGRAAAANALVQTLAGQVEEASASPRRRLRVFVYDCCDPPFTAGRQTVLNEMIARAGGQNIFADLDAAWAHVTWEDVVSRTPEFVVIHAYAHAGQGDVDAKGAMLRRFPSLAQLPTTVLPLGCSLGGLRSAEGVQRLQAAWGARL